MVAKIIIKRRFKKGDTHQIVVLLNEIRKGAMGQPGYISGETWIRSDDPNSMVVIATWQSIDDWYNWKDSDSRKKFEAMLELYQEKPTEYEEFILGTPLHKEQGAQE